MVLGGAGVLVSYGKAQAMPYLRIATSIDAFHPRDPQKRLMNGERTMNCDVNEVKVGMEVPDFDLTCYDPKAHDFTSVKLAELKKKGKWTILFFYPADFTFV